MADTTRPFLKVLGFRTTYEKIPVKGDPLSDTLDAKGFKLLPNGQRLMENVETHWVKHAPIGGASSTINEERIRHIQIPDNPPDNITPEKLEAMRAKWAIIEPEYTAWLNGQQIATNGTSLTAWAAMTPEKVEVLRRVGVRSVEDVAHLTEGMLEKINLPNMRALRKEALLFLENRSASDAAQREADRDSKIDAQAMQIADLQEKLTAAMQLLEQAAANQPQKATDELSAVKAELDRLGISYHHRAGLETLKALLAETKAKEAA